MSIQKAIKSKNSGDFIDHVKKAYGKVDDREIATLLADPPKLKWSADTEMERLGLLTWLNASNSIGLSDYISKCIDNLDLRVAAIGCLYMFGIDRPDDAINLLEKAFEKAEASDDYTFYASAMVDVLNDGGISGLASSSRTFVRVPAEYYSSTMKSVTEDFSVSNYIKSDGIVNSLATGLSRSGNSEEANALIRNYADGLKDFSELSSFIYGFVTQIEGLPSDPRSVDVPMVEHIRVETAKYCFERANSMRANKNDKLELADYVNNL